VATGGDRHVTVRMRNSVPAGHCAPQNGDTSRAAWNAKFWGYASAVTKEKLKASNGKRKIKCVWGAATCRW
jgi:hypothetical protein